MSPALRPHAKLGEDFRRERVRSIRYGGHRAFHPFFGIGFNKVTPYLRKAGKSKQRRGKMKQGYYWPLYGEDHEVVFTYSDSRGP